MSTQTLSTLEAYQTEHPYIVREPSLHGVQARLKGTQISVHQVAGIYKAGALVDEIVQAYPGITPAALYDAISYYLDHQAEIDQEVDRNRLMTAISATQVHELALALTQDGLLTAIKPPVADLQPYQNRNPISTQGRPLSEIIIEERG